jgi:hypothetical protein
MPPKGKKRNQPKRPTGGKSDDKKIVIDTTRDPQDLLAEFVAKESGQDSRGVKYNSLKSLWEDVLSKSQKDEVANNSSNNTTNQLPELTVVQHGSSTKNTTYISGEEFAKQIKNSREHEHEIELDELESATPAVTLTAVSVKHDDDEAEPPKSEQKSIDKAATEGSKAATGSKASEAKITFQSWYRTSTEYWKDIDASNNGMLGGFAHISDVVCIVVAYS